MNKEEILEMSRQENLAGDERDRILSEKAKTFGVVGMAIMLLVLFCVKLTRRESAYDLLALYFSFFAASDVFRYRLLKDKKYLLNTFCDVFASIVFMIVFIFER